MKRFPRRERIPFPPLLTICSYKNLICFLRYSSRPSQTAAEPFSLSPVGNPSGGCQLQPHGNLTPALSPGHSRASIIIPPACHRHRRVLSPMVGFSSYGSPISRQRKCCTGSIGMKMRLGILFVKEQPDALPLRSSESLQNAFQNQQIRSLNQQSQPFKQDALLVRQIPVSKLEAL